MSFDERLDRFSQHEFDPVSFRVRGTDYQVDFDEGESGADDTHGLYVDDLIRGTQKSLEKDFRLRSPYASPRKFPRQRGMMT